MSQTVFTGNYFASMEKSTERCAHFVDERFNDFLIGTKCLHRRRNTILSLVPNTQCVGLVRAESWPLPSWASLPKPSPVGDHLPANMTERSQPADKKKKVLHDQREPENQVCLPSCSSRMPVQCTKPSVQISSSVADVLNTPAAKQEKKKRSRPGIRKRRSFRNQQAALADNDNGSVTQPTTAADVVQPVATIDASLPQPEFVQQNENNGKGNGKKNKKKKKRKNKSRPCKEARIRLKKRAQLEKTNENSTEQGRIS